MRNDSFQTENDHKINISILLLFTLQIWWFKNKLKSKVNAAAMLDSARTHCWNKYFQSEGGPSAMLCGLQLFGTQDSTILTLSTGDVELPPWAILEDNIKTA